jgi:hypothetical protein
MIDSKSDEISLSLLQIMFRVTCYDRKILNDQKIFYDSMVSIKFIFFWTMNRQKRVRICSKANESESSESAINDIPVEIVVGFFWSECSCERGARAENEVEKKRVETGAKQTDTSDPRTEYHGRIRLGNKRTIFRPVLSRIADLTERGDGLTVEPRGTRFEKIKPKLLAFSDGTNTCRRRG